MARRSLRGARTIITGASSGIGRALALRMAQAGARLVLTARREDRLRDVATLISSAGAEVHTVCGDITDEQLRQDLLARAASSLSGLDILINNAGLGAIGPLADAKPD